jgi:hypothetical protein
MPRSAIGDHAKDLKTKQDRRRAWEIEQINEATRQTDLLHKMMTSERFETALNLGNRPQQEVIDEALAEWSTAVREGLALLHALPTPADPDPIPRGSDSPRHKILALGRFW